MGETKEMTPDETSQSSKLEVTAQFWTGDPGEGNGSQQQERPVLDGCGDGAGRRRASEVDQLSEV